MIRVLLCDDDDLLRAGLSLILSAADGIEVIGEASSGQKAILDAQALAPDVVLMDIQMPDMDGIEATRRITAVGDNAPRVIIVTTFELDRYVFESLRAGASGFLLKRTPPEDLVKGIRVVADGDALLSPSVTQRLIQEFAEQPAANTEISDRLDTLTDREREVLEHVARGLNNTETAEQMFISESTAKTYLKRVLMKLGLRDRVGAVVFAYEAGLIKPGTAESIPQRDA